MVKGTMFIDFVSAEQLRKGLLEKLSLFIEAEAPKTDVTNISSLYISANPYVGKILARFDTSAVGVLEKLYMPVFDFLANEGVKVTGFKVLYLTP